MSSIATHFDLKVDDSCLKATRTHSVKRCCCVLFFLYGMDLRDVSSRKPDNNSISLPGLVWRNKHIRTGGLGLGKRLREIRHLISRHLPAVGVRKVSVSNESSQLPEF